MERGSFFNALLDSNGTPDRSYLAEDFARYFSSFIGDGVFPNPATNLQIISNNNMTITLKQGKAWINGYFYVSTDDLIFKIDPADGVLNRIDRVVIRMDAVARNITAQIKKGTFNSSPVPSILQRDADAYEIAIADIVINKGIISIAQSNIIDLRLNKELCGIVHGAIEQVDTTAIFNQFQSWYAQKQTQYDADISKWTDDKKKAFDSWYNSNTQAFLDEFNKWYGDNTSKWVNDFANWYKNTEAWEKQFCIWFDSIKNILDKDIAAKLSNKIDEIEKRFSDITSQGIIKKITLTNVIPTKIEDFQDGEIKLVYK